MYIEINTDHSNKSLTYIGCLVSSVLYTVECFHMTSWRTKNNETPAMLWELNIFSRVKPSFCLACVASGFGGVYRWGIRAFVARIERLLGRKKGSVCLWSSFFSRIARGENPPKSPATQHMFCLINLYGC